jgi:hypothetical protein
MSSKPINEASTKIKRLNISPDIAVNFINVSYHPEMNTA